MKRNIGIGIRVALIIDLLVFAILGSVFFAIDLRLKSIFNSLITSENLQIVSARADEIGQLMRIHQGALKLMSMQSPMNAKSERDCETYARSMSGQLGEDVTNVYVAWPDGRLRSTSGEYINVSDRDYFKMIFAEGKDEATSAPLLSRVTGKPAVILARAIMEGGKARSILAFELSLEKLSAITSTIKVGTTSYGWVVDNNGLVLAFPKPEAILKLDISVADEKNGYKGLDALAKELLSKTAATGRFIRNDKSLMSLFSAEVPNTPGWRLGVNVTTAEISRPITALEGILAAILAASLAVAGTVAGFIGHWIVKPIRGMAASFRELAEGEADLTKRLAIRRNDEIGLLSRDFDRFQDKLREIVAGMQAVQAEIRSVGAELDGSTASTVGDVGRIEELIESVRERIVRQARSIEGSSSAVDQGSGGIDRLDGLIAEQSASIVEASASIEEMVSNINAVTVSVEKIAAEFSELSAASATGRTTQSVARERIAQISEQSEGLMEANAAIGAIASQTNLLAMNAAIEAAHAGEAGKGFSVVADEIRRLAETSAEQSKTIGATMTAIQEGIRGVVESSRESEKAFDELGTKIATTDSLVAEVKMAMAEQKEGSSQILTAIKDMNDIAASVKASSSEMSSGNKAILAEMVQLKESSREIGESARDIAESASNIGAGAQAISALAARNEEAVARMEDAVGRFKT